MWSRDQGTEKSQEREELYGVLLGQYVMTLKLEWKCQCVLCIMIARRGRQMRVCLSDEVVLGQLDMSITGCTKTYYSKLEFISRMVALYHMVGTVLLVRN